MLKLNLSPIRSDDEQSTVSWQAPVFTVDAVEYDLSLLEDGATAQHPVLGKVSRTGDDYECTIRLGHGPNAPHETRFPAPIVLENHNGPIELPLYDVVPEEDQEPTP